MNASQDPANSDVASELASLAALRGRHRELLQESGLQAESPEFRPRVLAFLEAGTRVGAVIESRPDRSAAQALLDYWVGFLLTQQPAEGAEVPDAILAPFDPSAVPDLAGLDSPYMGLAAFGVAEAARFFGRQEAKASLYEAFLRHPIVVVTGPSGSGKSSLVRAGLLARLESDRELGPRRVLPVVIPGADPVGALLRAIRAKDSPEGADISAGRKALAADPTAFAALAGAGSAGPPLVLVVDQLEEIFSLCQDHPARLTFAGAVGSLARSAAGHRVVLAVRSDYLKPLFALPDFTHLAAQPEVLFAPAPLSPSELREVIVRPAETVGLKFDEGIVDDLIQEVRGEPTALPLLQFALQRLWESRERNRISWEVYRRVGSPGEALKRTADGVYGHLPQELDRDVARLVFQNLVEPAVGIEFVRRRVSRELLHKLANAGAVDAVLSRFMAAGLLRSTPGESPEEDRFEVTHEALIRNWPLLSGWLKDKRESHQERLRFRAAAELSRNSGWDAGTLLGGAVLKRSEAYSDLTPVEKEFLVHSNLLQDRTRREKEEQLSRQVWGRNIVIVVILAISSFAIYQAWQALEEERRASALAEDVGKAHKAARLAAEKALEDIKAIRDDCFLYKQGVANLLKSPAAVSAFADPDAPNRGELNSLIRIIETSERPALAACDDRLEEGVSPYWRDRFAGHERTLARALRSTGRVEQETANGFQPNSTGFVIGEGLVFVFGARPLESALRVDGAEPAGQYWINFGAENGCILKRASSGAEPPDRYPLGEVVRFYESPRGGSFALYRVPGLAAARHPPLEIASGAPAELAGRTVFTVGHPSLNFSNLPKEVADLILGGGGPGIKRLSPGTVVSVASDLVTHDCTTLGGSGGGPLVDLETGQVLGVHFSKAGIQTVTPQRNLAAAIGSFKGLEELVRPPAPPAPPPPSGN